MATQIVDAGPILCSPICERLSQRKPAFLEFFAGSGLVSYALGKYFRTAWAAL